MSKTLIDSPCIYIFPRAGQCFRANCEVANLAYFQFLSIKMTFYYFDLKNDDSRNDKRKALAKRITYFDAFLLCERKSAETCIAKTCTLVFQPFFYT
ncbi:hypothetical protein ACTXT7_001116 [Hymenolepis weldensis]